MKAIQRLGHIGNTAVYLHLSWFVIIGLITVSMATLFLPQQYPSLSETSAWILGGLTGLFFLISILLHELGHIYAAKRHSVVPMMTVLFGFGGVTWYQRSPATAMTRLRVALAGPFVSLGLALFFSGERWINEESIWIAIPAEWLAYLNLAVGILNLLPVVPLDGSYMWRELTWRGQENTQSQQATTAFMSELIAMTAFAAAFFTLLMGQFLLALCLAVLGWSLQQGEVTYRTLRSVARRQQWPSAIELKQQTQSISSAYELERQRLELK